MGQKKRFGLVRELFGELVLFDFFLISFGSVYFGVHNPQTLTPHYSPNTLSLLDPSFSLNPSCSNPIWAPLQTPPHHDSVPLRATTVVGGECQWGDYANRHLTGPQMMPSPPQTAAVVPQMMLLHASTHFLMKPTTPQHKSATVDTTSAVQALDTPPLWRCVALMGHHGWVFG